MPGIDPISLGTQAASGLLEWRKANEAVPEFNAPTLSPEQQANFNQVTQNALQNPADIAASRMAGAKQAFGSATQGIPEQNQQRNTALGMADPNNISSAINSRMMRSLQGKMGAFQTQLGQQAQLESAQRMSQASHLALEHQKMQNAISQAKVQSEQNKILTRQGIINDVIGGVMGFGGKMAAGGIG